MAVSPSKTKEQTRPSDLRLLVLGAASGETNVQNQSSNNDTPITQPLSQASPFPAFLEALTNKSTPSALTTFSGYTSHPELHISTKYFSSKITLWCDEFASESSPATGASTNDENAAAIPPISQWIQQMRSEAASEVREAVGALAILLPFTQAHLQVATTRDELTKTWLTYIETLDPLCEVIEDETSRSPAKIAILQDSTPSTSKSTKGSSCAEEILTEMEDRTISDRGLFGWDFVLFDASPASTARETARASADTDKNEFGEAKGMPRVFEILSTIDWTQKLSSADDDEYDYHLASTEDIEEMLDGVDDFRPGMQPNVSGRGFGVGVDPVTQQSHEFQREIADLHFALEYPQDISGAGGEQDGAERVQVDQLAGLMERVVAIRDAGAEMGKGERERFAKREVAKIMREMG